MGKYFETTEVLFNKKEQRTRAWRKMTLSKIHLQILFGTVSSGQYNKTYKGYRIPHGLLTYNDFYHQNKFKYFVSN